MPLVSAARRARDFPTHASSLRTLRTHRTAWPRNSTESALTSTSTLLFSLQKSKLLEEHSGLCARVL